MLVLYIQNENVFYLCNSVRLEILAATLGSSGPKTYFIAFTVVRVKISSTKELIS